MEIAGPRGTGWEKIDEPEQGKVDETTVDEPWCLMYEATPPKVSVRSPTPLAHLHLPLTASQSAISRLR